MKGTRRASSPMVQSARSVRKSTTPRTGSSARKKRDQPSANRRNTEVDFQEVAARDLARGQAVDAPAKDDMGRRDPPLARPLAPPVSQALLHLQLGADRRP